jgi:urease accessory protein UreE
MYVYILYIDTWALTCQELGNSVLKVPVDASVIVLVDDAVVSAFMQHLQLHVIRQHTATYGSIRQHTSAYVSIRQHTSAYVSIRQHTSTTQ